MDGHTAPHLEQITTIFIRHLHHHVRENRGGPDHRSFGR
nr:MAG TPA: hypothetical protein [Caudoviricetes sp.]